MKSTKLFLIVNIILLTCTVSQTTKAQTNFGVNLACAEFGATLPGTYNIDYTYPKATELDYYKSKGLLLIRLPFKWERIQPTLNGSLNTTELTRLKNFVQLISDRNMKIILDLHNYGRYKLNGTEEIIGSANLPVSAVVDVWSKLANEFKNNSAVWAYGIMNEPHDMLQSTPWFNIAQSIIDGIRLADSQTTILVGGDSWSSAERWPTESNNLKNLIDPSNKLIYEAHVYFDDDASGTYNGSYDTELTTANTGINRVTPFVNWLNTNNLKGYIGEYGIPGDDSRWLTVLDNFLSYLSTNNINGTYWAGGPWWGSYPLSIEPASGIDKPQMDIVKKYLSTNTNTSSKSLNNQECIYPNPATDHITLGHLDSDEEIQFFNSIGQWVTTLKTKSKRIDNLDKLQPGLYILKNKNGTVIGRITKR